MRIWITRAVAFVSYLIITVYCSVSLVEWSNRQAQNLYTLPYILILFLAYMLALPLAQGVSFLWIVSLDA